MDQFLAFNNVLYWSFGSEHAHRQTLLTYTTALIHTVDKVARRFVWDFRESLFVGRRFDLNNYRRAI